MKCYLIRNVALLLLVSAVLLVLSSCQNKTADKSTGGPIPASYTEYSVDISDDHAPSQSISKTNDGRIVWVNNSNGPLYVCIDPGHDPFEAYGWYLLGGDKPKSGKIVDGLNPAAGTSQSFTFNPSSTACPGARADQGVKSTPKIIIVQH